MRKAISLLVLLLWLSTNLYVGATTITLPFTFTANTTIQSSQVNSNFTTITGVVNGGLDNSNIAAAANINPSKLNLTAAYLNIASAAGTLGFGVGQSGDTIARGGIYGDGSLQMGPGSNTATDIGLKRSAANTFQFYVPGGGTPILDFNSATFSNFVNKPVNGGTGLSTITARGVMIGEGTANVATAATNGSGTALMGNGSSADPSFQTLPVVAGGRLTTSSTLPVPTADATSITTIYYLPYTGTKITLWDSTHSQVILDDISTTGISVALTGSTSGNMYDVFATDATGSGTVTLSLVNQGADSAPLTRTTALAYGTHLGCLVLSGTESSRYLGSIHMTATGTTEDTVGDRAVYNYYNRVSRSGYGNITTASWTYTTATWRASNGNTTNGQGRISFLIGVVEDGVDAHFMETASGVTANATVVTGIDLNSSSATPGNQAKGFSSGASFTDSLNVASPTAYPSLGYNFIQAMELGDGSNANQFIGGPSFALMTSFRM